VDNKIVLPTNTVKAMRASEILANARERLIAYESYDPSTSAEPQE